MPKIPEMPANKTTVRPEGRHELRRSFWQTMWLTVIWHIVYELSAYVLTLIFALKSEQLTDLVLKGDWSAFRAQIPLLLILIVATITSEPVLRLARNRVLLRESLDYERLVLARYLRQATAEAKKLPAANMTDRLQIDLVIYRFSLFTLCANPLNMLLCLTALVLLIQRQAFLGAWVLFLLTIAWIRASQLKAKAAQAESQLLELEHLKNDRLMDIAEHHNFYYSNQLKDLPQQNLEEVVASLSQPSYRKSLATLARGEEFTHNSDLVLQVLSLAFGLLLCHLGYLELTQLVSSMVLISPLLKLHSLWTSFQEARFRLKESEKRIVEAVSGEAEAMVFDQQNPENEKLFLGLESDRAKPATLAVGLAPLHIQALELQKLSCMYEDRPIFCDLDLHLERGDICLVQGPNGSGKTSLLTLLAGLQKPSGGSIHWILDQGEAVQLPIGSPLIQYLPQHPHFFSGFAWQNAVLEAEAWFNPEDFSSAKEAVQNFLTDFAFAGQIEQEVDAQGLPLSGGEQQKLQFSRRLRRPQAQVLILDEPSKFLDQDSIPALQDLILSGQQDRITILITHDKRLLDLPYTKILDMEKYRWQTPAPVTCDRD